MGQSRLGQQERAADVDVHHQVEFLGGQFLGRFGRDGAGVVDDDVDTAEVFDRRIHRALHVLFFAHVADDRDALAARSLHVGHGGVHGAGQLGVGFGRFRQKYDVCALLRRTQRDRQSDAAGAA